MLYLNIYYSLLKIEDRRKKEEERRRKEKEEESIIYLLVINNNNIIYFYLPSDGPHTVPTVLIIYLYRLYSIYNTLLLSSLYL